VEVGTDEKGNKLLFTHPYFQCANMFLGELLCLFIWFFKTGCKGQKANDVEDDEEIPLSPGS